MKRLKALLVAAVVTAISIIPVLADITGVAPTTTTTSVTTTNITEMEYLIGDIDNSGSIDLTDARLSLKAALKIITLNAPAAKAADVNSDGLIDLTDAQITLKLALHIISVDNLYLKPDYLDLFITAINSENFYINDRIDPYFLALYSYGPEITNEQLNNLAQSYHGILVCTVDDLHQQGLLSIPADEPLELHWNFTIPNGVHVSFTEAKTDSKQITISWSYCKGGMQGAKYDSTFEVKNRKWVLIDTKLTGIA